jgi:hypothetical protein
MLEHVLTERLGEDSAVMAAAEGLSPEQRMLARVIEINGVLKALEAEKEDLSQSLTEHYLETGERVAIESLEWATHERATHTYDDERLRAEQPHIFQMFARFDGARAKKAVDAGVIRDADIAEYRTSKIAAIGQVRKVR